MMTILRPLSISSGALALTLLCAGGCKPGECEPAAQPVDELRQAVRGDDYDRIAGASEQLIAALEGTSNEELSMFKIVTEDLLKATKTLQQPIEDPAEREKAVGNFQRRQEGWRTAGVRAYADACK